MITLYLTTTKGPFSAAVRWFTRSKFSHVLIKDGDYAIEARAFHGVRRVPMAQALQGVYRLEVIEIETHKAEQIMQAYRSQIGKGYDYKAILGFVLKRRSWHHAGRWICSELAAWGFAVVGEPVFRMAFVHGISPNDWWTISPNRLKRT